MSKPTHTSTSLQQDHISSSFPNSFSKYSNVWAYGYHSPSNHNTITFFIFDTFSVDFIEYIFYAFSFSFLLYTLLIESYRSHVLFIPSYLALSLFECGKPFILLPMPNILSSTLSILSVRLFIGFFNWLNYHFYSEVSPWFVSVFLFHFISCTVSQYTILILLNLRLYLSPFLFYWALLKLSLWTICFDSIDSIPDFSLGLIAVELVFKELWCFGMGINIGPLSLQPLLWVEVVRLTLCSPLLSITQIPMSWNTKWFWLKFSHSFKRISVAVSQSVVLQKSLCILRICHAWRLFDQPHYQGHLVCLWGNLPVHIYPLRNQKL